ncbi:MAG TPA: alpha-glucuronidase family glycosyl hydrolase [Terriglobia bacterium]|nr:alpha-glucuronidase family glycosyl hydrolase [Terriglobia bacterium]
MTSATRSVRERSFSLAMRARKLSLIAALLLCHTPERMQGAAIDPPSNEIAPGVSVASASAVRLAADGKAQAVVILGEAAGEGAKFAATELQKYLHALSGADFQIATPGENVLNSPRQTWILIGGPDQNPFVKRAVDAGLAGFSGLKNDGFVLKTYRLDRRPVVIAGGNDDAGTMYAVFELLKRLGVTFRLTGDIVPAQRPSLEIPTLDLRLEPALAQRGFLMEASHHPSITMLGYDDYSRMLDQMAKMKDNYLMIWWFAYSPFLKYSYRGETKLLGDMATKASSYLNSLYAGGGSQTTDDVSIGKHWFPGKRLVPPEMQSVETPEQAYTTAQNLMQRVIHYAGMRHVKIWLVDEISVAPPNLARHGERIFDLPFERVFGTFMHPLDPVNREIQVNTLKAYMDTYPEAAGYFLNFSEVYVPPNNAKHRDFFAQQEPAFQELRSLIQPWADRLNVGIPAMIDSDIGYFDLFKYLMAQRDAISPKTRLGLMTVGRGYVMPLFDRMLPKDISFATFDSGGRCGYGTPDGMPMSYFGGMGERQRIFSPYLDDDCDMLGMQFNIGTYTRKDRIFTDGVKNGLTGVAPWMAEPRGTEHNSSFLAEAAWNPKLTRDEFYQDYARRLFGAKAAPDMDQAFLRLEENQDYLVRESTGFGNDPRPTTLACCGSLPEVRAAYKYSLQPNPYDGPTDPDWSGFIIGAAQVNGIFEGSIALLDRALASMHAAEPNVEPRGRKELAYLICRTEAYRDDIRAEITERQAFMAFDHAFRVKDATSAEEFVASLEASLKLFETACQQAQIATTKYAEIVDYPSDLETLYHLNAGTVLGFDMIRQWMQKIVSFHEGTIYTGHVPFEHLFPGGVQFAH